MKPATSARLRYYYRQRFLLNLRTSLLIAGLILALVFSLMLVHLANSMPDVSRLAKEGVDPVGTSRILAADGSVIMSYGKFAHRPVPLSAISPHIKKAVLSTEDRRFYWHGGIDPQGILRAIFRNAGAGEIRQGGSTLSQQLARTLFLSNERSLTRKLKEAFLALRMESQFSKDEILALYLNNVYFGEGAYGVEAASRVYFNKSAKEVDIPQSAMLAGLIQAPSQYDPYIHPEAAEKRRNEVLQNMVENRVLEKEEVARLSKVKVKLDARGRQLANPDKAPFFNRYVLKQALARLKMDEKTFWREGLRVHTTLDLKAQKVAEEQIQKVIYLTGRRDQEGALLSLDSRNRMIAYVGGQNFSRNQYDHVMQARRPAGSLMKALVYTAAVTKGISPLAVYRDRPIRYGDWRPQNYDKRYRGEMNLAQAMIKSNNVIAIQVLEEITPTRLVNLAREFGIKAKMPPYLSLALGAADVTLAEMTAAYSVYRQNGYYTEPYAIEKILSKDGKALYTHPERSRLVLDRHTRDTMVSLLQGVVQYGTGRAADYGAPVAGKTGTSDDYRDAWFIGFTPDVTTGVWLGTDNNAKMARVTGGSIPATLWKNYMKTLSNKKDIQFDLAYGQSLTKEDFLEKRYSPVLAAEPPVFAVDEWLWHRDEETSVQPVRKSQGHRPVMVQSAVSAVRMETPDKEKKAWGKIKKELKKPWRKMKETFGDDD